MIRPARRHLLMTALLLACGGDSTGPGGEVGWIAGRWAGSASFGAVRFSAVFTQDGNDVGGSGSFTSPLGGGPFTVTSGHVDGADVSLVLTSQEYGTATYIGRFETGDRISGNLDASSYSDIDLTIERQ